MILYTYVEFRDWNYGGGGDKKTSMNGIFKKNAKKILE